MRSQPRRVASEDGFTLLELMIVVLILAILIAVAVPSLLGARARAQDAAAKSALRHALAAENVYYADRFAYTDNEVALREMEPALVFDDDDDPELVGVVYVEVENDVVYLGARSESGTCFYLGASPATGVQYRRDGGCNDVDAPAGWSASW